MAGRNTRLQTVNKAAARRLFFLCKNIFIQNVTFRRSRSLITASAKQATRTQAAKQTPAQRGRKRKQTPATSRTGQKAVRRSVEQIRLTVSGLVTANVQAYIDMQAGKNRPCKAFRAIAYKTAHYMEFVPHLPCKRLNLHCVET